MIPLPLRVRTATCAVMAILLPALLSVSPSRATTVRRMDVESLTVLSSCVVEGTVLRVGSAWDESRTRIHTDIDFEVSRVLSGACAPGLRTLRTLGGAVDRTAMSIPGAPTFETGEKLVLFLEDGSLFPTVGLFQGKLTVETDPGTGDVRIGNDALGWFARPELETRIQSAIEGR